MGAGMQRSSTALCHRRWITAGPGEQNRREGKVNLFGNTWSMPCSREQLFLWDFLRFSLLHLRSHPVPLTVPRAGTWRTANYFLNWQQVIFSPFPTSLREQKEACKRFNSCFTQLQLFTPTQGRREPCKPLLQPKQCNSLQTGPRSFSFPSPS